MSPAALGTHLSNTAKVISISRKFEFNWGSWIPWGSPREPSGAKQNWTEWSPEMQWSLTRTGSRESQVLSVTSNKD